MFSAQKTEELFFLHGGVQNLVFISLNLSGLQMYYHSCPTLMPFAQYSRGTKGKLIPYAPVK